MPQKRLRVFAGPNGSGKSSLLDRVLQHGVALGAYINADEIEKALKAGFPIDLDNYNVTADDKHLKNYFRKSNYAKSKSDIKKLVSKFKIVNNIIVDLHSQGPEPKYSAAILAGFLREIT